MDALKTCACCGKAFHRPPRISAKQWNTRRFCSYGCRRPTRVKKRDPRTCFDQHAFPEPMSGCWLWNGTYAHTGYGQIRINGTVYGAHRLSYELHVGAIPTGMSILHKCDNRACVNPGHLYAGTQSENMRDMVQRNRSATGARNHATKLTPKAVQIIRASQDTDAAIAHRFGVSRPAVRNVRMRRVWRHVE